VSSLFRFRHFQSRLLVFFLLPLGAVLATVYLAVSSESTRNALAVINGDLAIGAESFVAAIENRNETLAIAGDALSSDFAFRQAYGTRDPATLLSAMDNLLSRLINADFIALAGTDGLLLADTLQPARTGAPPAWLPLIEQARELDRQGLYPEAEDLVILDGRPYHLTVLPFLAPDLLAWIGLGFELDQRFTAEFKRSTAAEVSVLFRAGTGPWQLNGSTLPEITLDPLVTHFNTTALPSTVTTVTLAGEDYVTLTRPLGSDGSQAMVVLQRSLAAQLAPFNALRQTLLTIFALGLVLLAVLAIAVSRSVTRPVRQLAASARRIEAGDYRQSVELPLRDEIGELAQAFNGMARGLAEKDRVRDLLGKVVSPEIAAELLRSDIELGGEEREVTILFSDVRGFTSLCEGQSPRQILGLLNEYFAAISGVIEANGGVVDKYIGDAVMALFGAPVASEDAPARAVRTALQMFEALATLNTNFSARGLQPVGIGIGINTDHVVAGNMGSQSRLNYTVIGDGVNLASRLEGLCRIYGTGIIISDNCRRLAPGFLYLPLDQVRVKGKQEPVRIFTPVASADSFTPQQAEMVSSFAHFLQLYQAGDFTRALPLLAEWELRCNEYGFVTGLPLARLYRDRLLRLCAEPPANWDGIHAFTDK
jgi:adenylate cyclase